MSLLIPDRRSEPPINCRCIFRGHKTKSLSIHVGIGTLTGLENNISQPDIVIASSLASKADDLLGTKIMKQFVDIDAHTSLTHTMTHDGNAVSSKRIVCPIHCHLGCIPSSHSKVTPDVVKLHSIILIQILIGNELLSISTTRYQNNFLDFPLFSIIGNMWAWLWTFQNCWFLSLGNRICRKSIVGISLRSNCWNNPNALHLFFLNSQLLEKFRISLGRLRNLRAFTREQNTACNTKVSCD